MVSETRVQWFHTPLVCDADGNSKVERLPLISTLIVLPVVFNSQTDSRPVRLPSEPRKSASTWIPLLPNALEMLETPETPETFETFETFETSMPEPWPSQLMHIHMERVIGPARKDASNSTDADCVWPSSLRAPRPLCAIEERLAPADTIIDAPDAPVPCPKLVSMVPTPPSSPPRTAKVTSSEPHGRHAHKLQLPLWGNGVKANELGSKGAKNALI